MNATMRRVGISPSCAALTLLLPALLLAACAPASQAGSVQRRDLFSIGYGMSENQIDLSTQGRDGIDLTMSKGIFHMLDGSGRKVMRLSSYGDLLALLYDPSISPVPNIVEPLALAGIDTAGEEGRAAGRYAVPVTFTQPRAMAVGLDQTIYVADKVAQASARIYDTQLASYCDRIIRRFGTMGQEKAYLGQEGPGGSPFPAVMAMDVFDDNTLGIISVTESAFLVYHFGKEGNLLSSLRIGQDALPLPVELSENEGESLGGEGTEGTGISSRIHANLDSMMMASGGESFRIVLKLDYYREYYDSASLAISRNEYAGSWIFTMDGWTGRIESSLSIAAGGEEVPVPELIGQNSGLYYLLYSVSDRVAENSEAGTTQTGKSWMIQLMDDKGKVHNRARIDPPEGVREMITIRVSEEGQVYALLKMDEKVQISMWNFR